MSLVFAVWNKQSRKSPYLIKEESGIANQVITRSTLNELEQFSLFGTANPLSLWHLLRLIELQNGVILMKLCSEMVILKRTHIRSFDLTILCKTGS